MSMSWETFLFLITLAHVSATVPVEGHRSRRGFNQENRNTTYEPDHHAYYCQIHILESTKRASRWHFNVSLLQNPTFC